MIRSVRSALVSTRQRAAWGLCALVAYLIWTAYPPASFWLDVRAVHIDNAAHGQSPTMTVFRTIRRPFDGEWRAELERETKDGFVTMEPVARGAVSYNTDAALPVPLLLDWWTYPAEWRPLPGRYRVETCWTIKLMLVANRRTCKHSNVFTVQPP